MGLSGRVETGRQSGTWRGVPGYQMRAVAAGPGWSRQSRRVPLVLRQQPTQDGSPVHCKRESRAHGGKETRLGKSSAACAIGMSAQLIEPEGSCSQAPYLVAVIVDGSFYVSHSDELIQVCSLLLIFVCLSPILPSDLSQ